MLKPRLSCLYQNPHRLISTAYRHKLLIYNNLQARWFALNRVTLDVRQKVPTTNNHVILNIGVR